MRLLFTLFSIVANPDNKVRDWPSKLKGMQHKTDKAYKAASQAVERYPGCGRLHFKLAKIADQMNKTGIAIEHYAKTVEIEDEYRAQFKQLYPERQDVVSRIGNKDYKYAKERVAKLAGKVNN